MHSRIFQVSSKPITEDNLIKEYRYEDDFVGRVAGYVSLEYSEVDIKSDLEWLNNTEGLHVDTDKKTLTITSKREYFDEKHDTFIELAEKLSNITLEEFINGEWDKGYGDFTNLKDSYEDTYGFYIDDNDENIGLTTLDNWVRNAEENKAYYIGNIFDYHF
jgi:hypothetical protein